MNHAHQLKSNAVVPTEIHRQSRGSGLANQPDRRVIPRRVDDLRRRHLPLRHFASRKNRQHAALLQPGQCLPQGSAVGLYRAIALKRVYKNAMPLQLRHIGEQEVGQHLHVWPHSCQQHSENRTVQNTVRMIRHYHHRTACRNPRLIVGAHAQSDSHLGEQGFQAKSIGRSLHSAVQIPDFTDTSEFRCQAGELSHARQHFALRLIRMQMV